MKTTFTKNDMKLFDFNQKVSTRIYEYYSQNRIGLLGLGMLYRISDEIVKIKLLKKNANKSSVELFANQAKPMLMDYDNASWRTLTQEEISNCINELSASYLGMVDAGMVERFKSRNK